MHKLFVGSLVLVFCTLVWGGRGLGEQVPAPRGELRIVDKNPANWAWITYNVFETLIEVDMEGKRVPKLATGWRWLDDRTLEVTLRQGVKFHNGSAKCSSRLASRWSCRSWIVLHTIARHS